MKTFKVVPSIVLEDSCESFCKSFDIGSKDLILTNPTYFEGYFDNYSKDAQVFYLKNYGTGEPTDIMVEALYKDIEGKEFDRVIAIGGGSIIDVAKILVQEKVIPLNKLFDKTVATNKIKELIIIPTTCGTGSEVTSVSVIDMTSMGGKLGLQTDEEYADCAVLIPEVVKNIPEKFFATSSIDALIHAIESYMSPKATAFSEMYSKEAIRMIIGGYRKIVAATNRDEKRKEIIGDFLLASTYAGIAFGNAGCAAVHAMSMPFSGAHHVPHGEANYVIFTGVFKAYNRINPEGKIRLLNKLLSELLDCEESDCYIKLEELLDDILPKMALHEYGVDKSELAVFTDIVMTKQGRLTANNYVPLGEDEVFKIYESLY